MLWVNHGPCLRAIGGSRAEYYEEVRRQLRRFILSLDRLGESLAEQIYQAATGVPAVLRQQMNALQEQEQS
jgi:hypothetical protein